MFAGTGSSYGRSLLKETLAKSENSFVKSLSFVHKSLSDAGLVGLQGTVAAKDAEKLIALFSSLLKSAAGSERAQRMISVELCLCLFVCEGGCDVDAR